MIVEQGWQCPICKRVYNPRQEMCLYCGGNGVLKDITVSAKKIQDGISWTNSDTVSTPTISNWTTIRGCCDTMPLEGVTNASSAIASKVELTADTITTAKSEEGSYE